MDFQFSQNVPSMRGISIKLMFSSLHYRLYSNVHCEDKCQVAKSSPVKTMGRKRKKKENTGEFLNYQTRP